MNDNSKTRETSRRGLVLVLSSPSGAGKSTLAKHLLNSDDEIQEVFKKFAVFNFE